MYRGEELTQAEIANRAGCHRRTIATWFRRHDIEGRPADQRKKVSNSGPWDDEEILRELYIEKRQTLSEIADLLGTSEGTIQRRMEEFGIERRDQVEYLRQGPTFVRFDTNGYLRAESAVDGEKDMVYVHQLVAIADGADPRLFSVASRFTIRTTTGPIIGPRIWLFCLTKTISQNTTSTDSEANS